MYYFVLLLAILQLAAISIVAAMLLRSYAAKERNAFRAVLLLGMLTAIFIFLAIGAYHAYIFYYGYYYPLLIVSISTMLISIMLAYSYAIRPCLFVGLMLLFIYGMFIYGAAGTFAYGIGIFGVGTMYGLLYRGRKSKASAAPSPRNDIKIETNRDILQIGLGIIVMLIIAAGKVSIPVISVLIITAYAFNNSLPGSNKHVTLYAALNRFERRGSAYGLGAIYLVAGTSMLVGFINHMHFLEAAIAVLFIGDALATIIGMRFGMARLPYNRRKTVGGFAAFAIVGAVSFYAIGIGAPLSIALAFALAFVESISSRFDDNITVPIALIILFYALF
ncbi:MAG: hypothetical protein QXW10_00035 [Candidatus Micrarchaeaceae archaeon]